MDLINVVLFSQHSNLVQPIRTHTGERSKEGYQCSTTFTTHDVLKSHIRTSNGEKLFECHQCGNGIAYPSILFSPKIMYT